jgi:hypothetical protein
MTSNKLESLLHWLVDSFESLSIVFIFNEIRRFGRRLGFRVQVKWEEAHLVDPLETTPRTHRAQ